MADEELIKDFSYTTLSHPFRIGEDVFHALPDIPLSLMSQIVMLTNIQDAVAKQGEDVVLNMFAEFLQDESGAVFKQRVKDKKIGIKKITEILPWILEKNGIRPTQPSSDSSDGLDDVLTGTSSMDGARHEASIL